MSMSKFNYCLNDKIDGLTVEELITMLNQKLNITVINGSNGLNAMNVDNHYYRRGSLDSPPHSDTETVASVCGSVSASSACASALMSPIGSPNRRQNFPLFNAKIGNKVRESDLFDERENSKHDFNRNGIEVPLFTAEPYQRYDMDNQRCGQRTDETKAYELFPKRSFELTPVSGKRPIVGASVANRMDSMDTRIDTFETKPTPLYSKMKAKPRRIRTQMFCSFCKNNNETKDMFDSHILKDPEGKTMCPILRAYNCPICNNGGGEYAHTIRYCPLNKSGQCMPSVIKLLKNSRSSDGKRRNAFHN